MKLPKKVKAKWLKALRSGEYRQAQHTLYKPETAGFCCLGVLQHCMSGGKVEVYEDGSYFSTPSYEWYKSIGGVNCYNSDIETELMKMNDDRGCKFKTIANYIEKHVETTD